MERPSWQGFLLVNRSMGSLEPASGYFSLGYVRMLHLPFSRGLNRYIRADILQDDNPIRILLIDLRPEMEGERTFDLHVFRKRIGHVPQFLHLSGLGKRHLSKAIRCIDSVSTRWREGLPS